jgi:hypothetical protein
MYGYTEMEALATYFDMDSWGSAHSQQFRLFLKYFDSPMGCLDEIGVHVLAFFYNDLRTYFTVQSIKLLSPLPYLRISVI